LSVPTDAGLPHLGAADLREILGEFRRHIEGTDRLQTIVVAYWTTISSGAITTT
jgi:hypothetical protein